MLGRTRSVKARTAARALGAQRDAIKSDVGGAQGDYDHARVRGDFPSKWDAAFNAVSGQRQRSKSWSGLPSADQRASLGYASKADERRWQGSTSSSRTDIRCVQGNEEGVDEQGEGGRGAGSVRQSAAKHRRGDWGLGSIDLRISTQTTEWLKSGIALLGHSSVCGLDLTSR